MENIQVTICVPIFGVEKYIERCARSLFEQSYANIEYIFVDDCTKDRSIEILCNVLKHYENRAISTHIIRHEKNRGLAAARNTAIANAHGEFVIHVDSDDFLELTAIEELVKFQYETQADFITFEAIAHYPHHNHRIKHKDFVSSRQLALAIVEGTQASYVWCRFIRRELYTTHQIEAKEGVNNGEDFQVSPVLAYYANKVATYHNAIYHYECRNDNALTKSFSWEKIMQRDISRCIVFDFFSHKGKDFNIALEEYLIRMLPRRIIESVKYRNRDYFLLCNKKKNETNRKLWHIIPLSKRVLLYVNNYNIVSFYIAISLVLIKILRFKPFRL